MRISLKQLYVFTAIAHEKTMAKAAERLYITKPAVSLSLSELEKHLGYKLFDRVSSRLVLNSEGRQLLPLADEMLERAEVIEHQFETNGLLSGSLHIGASDTIGNHIAPILLSKFKHQYSCDIQQLFISNTSQIINRLLDFQLDIGLVEGRAQHPKLHTIEWRYDDMYIVCSPKHPLAKNEIIKLEDLENSTWLLREEGSGSREYFLNHIATNLSDWVESLQLNTTEAIINCCSENMGLACVSQLAVKCAINDGRLVKLPYIKTLTRSYWLLLHKEKYQTPLLKQFLSYCKEN